MATISNWQRKIGTYARSWHGLYSYTYADCVCDNFIKIQNPKLCKRQINTDRDSERLRIWKLLGEKSLLRTNGCSLLSWRMFRVFFFLSGNFFCASNSRQVDSGVKNTTNCDGWEFTRLSDRETGTRPLQLHRVITKFTRGVTNRTITTKLNGQTHNCIRCARSLALCNR